MPVRALGMACARPEAAARTVQASTGSDLPRARQAPRSGTLASAAEGVQPCQRSPVALRGRGELPADQEPAQRVDHSSAVGVGAGAHPSEDLAFGLVTNHVGRCLLTAGAGQHSPVKASGHDSDGASRASPSEAATPSGQMRWRH